MLGNPDFQHETDFSYWCNMSGAVLILLADIGLIVSMAAFLHNWSLWKKFGAFVLLAALFSFLTFAFLFLAFGVFQFGDNDLPPYPRDTPFERAFFLVWFSIMIGAGVLWLFVLIYAIALLSKAIKRCLAT